MVVLQIVDGGNDELEYYKKEEIFLADGKLTITAKQENDWRQKLYSSRLITKARKFFTYGRVRISSSLPKGQGMWPAFGFRGENLFLRLSWA